MRDTKEPHWKGEISKVAPYFRTELLAFLSKSLKAFFRKV
jgi:hypothetical protein